MLGDAMTLIHHIPKGYAAGRIRIVSPMGPCQPRGSGDEPPPGGGGGSGPGPSPINPYPRCGDPIWTWYSPRYRKWLGLFWNSPSSPQKDLPVVLLVHGMGSDCNSMVSLKDYLVTNSYFRVAMVTLYDFNDGKGPSFWPNTNLLDTLIGSLGRYIYRNYDSTWNRSIVVVAHSRAGLETEGVIYLKNNPYVMGFVALGTPFYGSAMADFCNGGSWLNCGLFILDPRLFSLCLAFQATVPLVCEGFQMDYDILTGFGVLAWRSAYYRYIASDTVPGNIKVARLGMGWTPEWKCGTFPAKSQAGCFVVRYVMGAGCNDGVVEYGNASARDIQFDLQTKIFSNQPTGSGGRTCSGDPDIWEKDHTAIKEDPSLFPFIEGAILDTLPEETYYNAPFDIPITSPKEVRSWGYITLIDSTLYIMPSYLTDSVAIWSPSALRVLWADTVYLNRREYGYTYIAAFNKSSGQPLMKIEKERGHADLEGIFPTPVILSFLSPVSAYLRFNKHVYTEGEIIRIDIHHPFADSVMGFYYSIGPWTSYGVVRPVKVRDTFKAYLRLNRRGVYYFFFETYGKEPRTLVSYITVSPSYDEEDILSVYREVLGMNDNKAFGTIFTGIRPMETKLVHNTLKIDLPSGYFKVYDSNGRLVKEGKFGNYTIDMGGLKRGIYFVVVKNKVYKVIKR